MIAYVLIRCFLTSVYNAANCDEVNTDKRHGLGPATNDRSRLLQRISECDTNYKIDRQRIYFGIVNGLNNGK